MAEDEAVVHVEIEQAGEAESQQVTPNNIPKQKDGEQLQEKHLDNETSDATAEISGVMGAERVQTAVRDTVAPDEEVRDSVIGYRRTHERDGWREKSFTGIAVKPQVSTYPQHSRIDCRPH